VSATVCEFQDRDDAELSGGGEEKGGDGALRQAGAGIREQQHQTAREAISDGAAEEYEEQKRDAPGREDDAEAARVSDQVENGERQ
jgi:hypothetical protein